MKDYGFALPISNMHTIGNDYVNGKAKFHCFKRDVEKYETKHLYNFSFIPTSQCKNTYYDVSEVNENISEIILNFGLKSVCEKCLMRYLAVCPKEEAEEILEAIKEDAKTFRELVEREKFRRVVDGRKE